MCFVFNQIAGFSDWHYFWKESITILDFLHGDIYHGDMHIRLSLGHTVGNIFKCEKCEIVLF